MESTVLVILKSNLRNYVPLAPPIDYPPFSFFGEAEVAVLLIYSELKYQLVIRWPIGSQFQFGNPNYYRQHKSIP